MWRWVAAVVATGLIMGCHDYPECGGRDAAAPMGPNAGFIQPTEITQAYVHGRLQGNANYSCLFDGTGVSPTTVNVTLTGETRDYLGSDIVNSVDIAVLSADDPLTATPITTARSGMDGRYSLTLPIGTGRVSFVMTDGTDREEESGFVDSIEFHHALEPDVSSQAEDLFTFSHLTLAAVPAFAGEGMHSPEFGLMFGRIVDCDGNEVDGAIVTLSATSRTTDHLAADTFYFSTAWDLPVRACLEANTSHYGRFAVLKVPPTEIAYVQAWGYVAGQTPGVDDLTLLSEVPIVVVADTVGNALLEPLRQ